MVTTADPLPGEPGVEPSLLVTIDGVIETCNEPFAALCGAPSHGLRGRRMESLISEHLSEYLRACAGSDKPLAASFVLRSSSGTSEHRFHGLAHRAEHEPTPPRVLLVLRPVVTQDGACLLPAQTGQGTIAPSNAGISIVAKRESVSQTA